METHSPLTAAMRSDRTAATAASDAPSSLGAPATFTEAYPGLTAASLARAAKTKAKFVASAADKAAEARDMGDEFGARTWADAATRAAKEAKDAAGKADALYRGLARGHDERRRVVYHLHKAEAHARVAASNAEHADRTACAVEVAN